MAVRERNVGFCPTLPVPSETKWQTSAPAVPMIEDANCFDGRIGCCAAIYLHILQSRFNGCEMMFFVCLMRGLMGDGVRRLSLAGDFSRPDQKVPVQLFMMPL